jgi:hypothetical protein
MVVAPKANNSGFPTKLAEDQPGTKGKGKKKLPEKLPARNEGEVARPASSRPSSFKP